MEQFHDMEPVDLICVRCGHANNDRASRCSNCKSPLDDFASSSPWEMSTAKSSAYSPVSSPKTKPIIFWGVWLYFGPSAIGALWFIGSAIIMLISGEASTYIDNPDQLGAVVMGLVIALLYGLLSIWAVWSVSKGYFGKRQLTKHKTQQDGALDS